jgi:hypothetical protein
VIFFHSAPSDAVFLTSHPEIPDDIAKSQLRFKVFKIRDVEELMNVSDFKVSRAT